MGEGDRWISAHAVPAITANTLYFIYLDPGISSIMGGSRSCSSYCGYHDAVGQAYYAPRSKANRSV